MSPGLNERNPGLELANAFCVIPLFSVRFRERRQHLSTSIPNITLVVFNAVRLQERAVLILKRHSLVMLFLIFFVSNHFLQIGLTD